MSRAAQTLVESRPLTLVAEKPPLEPRNRKARSHRTKTLVQRISSFGIKAAIPLGLLILWDLLTRFEWIDSLFLPSPFSVLNAFYLIAREKWFLQDFRYSLGTVLQGYGVGASIGLLVGIAAGLSSTVEKLLGSTLNSIRQVPPLAWIPLIILWAGAASGAKTIVLAKTVFFPVFMNTLQGIRGVAKEHIEVGQVFEYSRWPMLRRVILPAALPSVFVGLRYGAGLAWAMLVGAEMFGGRRGLGYLLSRSQELLITDQLFLIIIIIGVVGFTIDTGLRRLERHLLRWKLGFAG
jgi:sulfonate transport system permease protein